MRANSSDMSLAFITGFLIQISLLGYVSGYAARLPERSESLLNNMLTDLPVAVTGSAGSAWFLFWGAQSQIGSP